MDTSKLAPETLRVWDFFSKSAALGGFILIGGTALTMRISHRISEDLDLTIHGLKLPRTSIDGLIGLAEREGFTASRDDDQGAYEEFLIAGMSLHDYQQNFIINGVKVNLFAANPDLAAMLDRSTEPLPRVATLVELFKSKALAAANRCVSRDWVDLYLLFTRHGFTISDFHNAFQNNDGIPDPAVRISRAFQNLCLGKAPAADLGFKFLMQDPPTLAEMADYFTKLRDRYEITTTREAFERRHGSS